MQKDEFDAQQVEQKIVFRKLREQIDRNKKKILAFMLKTNDPKKLSKYKDELIALDNQIEEFRSKDHIVRFETAKHQERCVNDSSTFVFTPTKGDNVFADFVKHFYSAIDEYNQHMKNEPDPEIRPSIQPKGTGKDDGTASMVQNSIVPEPRLDAYGTLRKSGPKKIVEELSVYSMIARTSKSLHDSLKNLDASNEKENRVNPIIQIKIAPEIVDKQLKSTCDCIPNFTASGNNFKRFSFCVPPETIEALLRNENAPEKPRNSDHTPNSKGDTSNYQKLSAAVYNQIRPISSGDFSQNDNGEGFSTNKVQCLKPGHVNADLSSPDPLETLPVCEPRIIAHTVKEEKMFTSEKLYNIKYNRTITAKCFSKSPSIKYYKLIRDESENLYAFFRKSAHIFTNLYIPKFLWDTLFPYQKEGVYWMYELFKKGRGCLLADEMGLGKTLQVIALLAGLFCCKFIKYCLIITPSTILRQWVGEFKRYFPFIRIILLHKSHTDSINRTFDEISKLPSIVLVSYDGFKLYQHILRKCEFSVVVLDEGHKIKNKNSEISQVTGQIPCKFKVVLTGTPIQNNLQELWAIFNFINQGLLGTFDEFVTEFEVPIKKGGFLCASEGNVVRAYKKSRLLKSLIEPYFLRRLKSSVANQLPTKSDKVLFCKLKPLQENMYRSFLDSDYVYKILIGKGNFLGGIAALRKICSHPFLHSKEPSFFKNLEEGSGKLQKTHELLLRWKSEGRKVLIFTQLLDMLELFEKYFEDQGFTYLKMEGKSTLKTREDNIEQFNSDPRVFIFLMTTRVGGLGLNLVGASRVILYDPDWNPSNDSQAKERAWRYGQELDVHIYRLISAGTIEEKIYQRQIFKSTLSRKILVDPKLSKFFEKDDISDLFSYDYNCTERTESMKIMESENQELEFLKKDVPEDIKRRFLAFKTKKLLTDDEMIEFITLRETHEKD